MGSREKGIKMESRDVSRRDLFRYGGAALAGLTIAQLAGLALAFPTRPGEEVLPWLDQPAPNPVPQIIGQQLEWEKLDSWITPTDKFFTITHFDQPVIAPQDWRLEITGFVHRPMTLTLDQIRARPRQEITFTLECSGNTGLPFFTGGIGNAVWTGTPLAPLLREAGVMDWGTEIVFWGTDAGPAEVAGEQVTEQFARSLSREDAMDPLNLLVYEMNGAPLDRGHGFPVRLIAPGWFGVANVKWLRRIEVLNTRFQGRFMAREYVTRREEERDGQTVAQFTLVGRDLLKSAPARVTRVGTDYRIVGAAWGAPIGRVEVQIDGGPWLPATIDEEGKTQFAWKIWSLPWGQPSPGAHMITSRATDIYGTVQPAMDDPVIANKKTFWESNGQITRRVQIGG
jgi:DMSO/TMAO reductase YedYZ molybdopterin-dependent catalytic subunit